MDIDSLATVVLKRQNEMATFGKRLKQRRGECKVSQTELAKNLGMHYTIIGKYEREEVNPTIDVVKNIAKVLDTTVGFLAGEEDVPATMRNASMINRLDELLQLSDQERDHVNFVLDAVLRDARARRAYGMTA